MKKWLYLYNFKHILILEKACYKAFTDLLKFDKKACWWYNREVLPKEVRKNEKQRKRFTFNC